MKKLIAAIKEILRLKCPDCNGTLLYKKYDDKYDLAVYECEDCGKEWV